MITILVDDKRDGPADIICRTIEGAKVVLSCIPGSCVPDVKDYTLLLDHDLGQGDEKDGIDLLIWARDNGIHLPSKIVLVSENPVGIRNMQNLLIHDLCYDADLSRRVFYHD